MLVKTLAVSILLSIPAITNAQILGGGPDFSNAKPFSQTWTASCPSGTTLSNQSAFEPSPAIDPCAPAPSCVTGTAQSDVWFYFFAETTTARIVVNPSASFNIALQAFSGNACPGLTDIGCIDAGGNGVTETLKLTGLIPNQMYYFRIFGSSNDINNRTNTGTYDFCGTAQLGSGAVLAAEISNFNATKLNTIVQLNWTAISSLSNDHFEIERSSNGTAFEKIGTVAGAGSTAQTLHYDFDDNNPYANSVNYYRLKEVSTMGTFKYSPVVSVRMGGKLSPSLTILSNPVADKLNIRVAADAATNIQLKVINELGQIVCRQNQNVVKGDNFISVSGSSLQWLRKGMYTLQVQIDNEVLNAKFISAQ